MGDRSPSQHDLVVEGDSAAVPRSRWPWLPALLLAMAERFGLDTALRFGKAFGGRVIYVPVKASPEHEIAKCFGIDVLHWLIDRHGASITHDPGKLVIPKGPSSSIAEREAAVMAMTDRGMSRNAIAAKLGIHARTVPLIRRRVAEREARQAAAARRVAATGCKPLVPKPAGTQ